MSDKPGSALFRLNVVQVVLAIAVSLGTVAVGFAAYITLPAKVTDLQTQAKALWEHSKEADAKRDGDHEILVRLEEQMKEIQSSQAEIKADVKALRKEPAPLPPQ